jgi:branched-chain amino acid transport system ATP-binding protein
MNALLKASSVSKYFGGLAANHDLSFEIREGEIIGLIGANGSGKTTLINVITGNHKAEHGSIEFKGQEIVGLKPYAISRLGIARTYQVVQPFKGMTVLENVLVGALFGRRGAGRRKNKAMERAENTLEFVQMLQKKDTSVENLTIAEIKRLEIAKALATEPELLLLDEVMAGLNPNEIDEALGFIRQINEMGVTILVVEHVMKAVMSTSQRVIVLNQGRLMCTGTPEEVVCNEEVIEAYLGAKYAKRKRDSGGN